MRFTLLAGSLLVAHVGAFLNPASPLPALRLRSSVCALQCSSSPIEGGAPSDSRRALLRVAGAAAGLLALSPAAFAGTPTMEEYNVGSGTVIRPKGGPARKQAGVAPVDKASALAAVEAADLMLLSFEPLCVQSAWDTIREAMQIAPVGQRFVKPDAPIVLFSPFLGFGSAGAMEKGFGMDKKGAAGLERSRKDAALVLNELADFAFTNRVIFFSEEDRASVSDLAEKNLSVDVSEAAELVVRAREKVADMRAALE
ncbi:hypothetical protein T484DRAFT_1981249 [Baffinella frigidus]|nr:hypothetical protein T484DRAFT_1981249 [Cryptophyta sp. CCMP2293]|mmetsp:Transcript_70638/g.169238  ORF Transcript_70638/g.169238 Transcript_70638/m.169238 type:complete len:256 (+) Transcript_70638:1-768(+)